MAERKIGDSTYRVEMLTAGDALVLYADVMRVVGNATGRLPAIIVGFSADDQGQNLMADVASIAAITDILKETDSETIRDLVGRIVRVAQVKRPSGVYEHVDLELDFNQADRASLIPVIKFVLTEQFRDFFTESAGSGIFGMLKEAFQKKRPSESPLT